MDGFEREECIERLYRHSLVIHRAIAQRAAQARLLALGLRLREHSVRVSTQRPDGRLVTRLDLLGKSRGTTRAKARSARALVWPILCEAPRSVLNCLLNLELSRDTRLHPVPSSGSLADARARGIGD
jgi:hypothetical protein